MDYNALLDLTTELGYQLAMCGAETFRVEESVNRVMQAYGIKAEAFAIPNCLHISIETEDGTPMTRMRRIGYHGNDLNGVERFSNLSRRICSECPEPSVGLIWLQNVKSERREYKLPIYLLGSFLGAFGFCILFGGSIFDSVSAGVCGILIGLVNYLMDKLNANPFFRTITASFLMALLAHISSCLHLSANTDAVIIGALMILVPGLLFINALRDIIYGDTNSGINRIVQVFLTAAAIALGTGAAWKLSSSLMTLPDAASPILHSIPVEAIACLVGCIGFAILFNIHGRGTILCAIGGVITWITYRLILKHLGSDITAYFWATIFAATYAEIMARIRKCPAIGYLVVSAFPLIPGAGVYYTMQYAVNKDMPGFTEQGMHTLAIAAVMAVGILLISTTARIITLWIQRKK